MKKVIVAGSRGITSYELVERTLLAWMDWYDITSRDMTIVSGTARGVDQLGEQFAREYSTDLIKMPADWDRFGKSAGYKRNREMAKVADAAVIFWDGESKGTKHMIDLAKEYNLKLHVFTPDGWEML
jgi:predicted Rossmann fold nucleotide-binding protein DprA/Smf involved in DNA uptake